MGRLIVVDSIIPSLLLGLSFFFAGTTVPQQRHVLGFVPPITNTCYSTCQQHRQQQQQQQNIAIIERTTSCRRGRRVARSHQQTKIEGKIDDEIDTTNMEETKPTTTTTESEVDVMISQFANDLQQLTSMRPSEPSADESAPVALISAGSSFTRLWTPETWMKHASPPHTRYLRHISKWHLSTSAKKILPACLISAIYALVTSYIFNYGRIGQYQLNAATKGAASAISALGAPLALLLTLRANSSLGRLNEARILWGQMVLRGRNLASTLSVCVMPFDPTTAILALRYLSIFGWSVKAMVRNESRESQQKVYETMLGKDEADWLQSRTAAGGVKTPIAIIHRLRQLISKSCLNDNSTPSNFFVVHTSMEKALEDLDATAGGCERLMTSPIPPTYSRHLSRIMCLYLMILPLASVASGMPPLGCMVASAIISYVLVGVDEIGMEVENPMPLLPLQQMSSYLQKLVGEMAVSMSTVSSSSDAAATATREK
mmetsp:Transcript_45385/g.110386  ORF Transcript_45385/g.110386 Transcript_45385/m.110386 type:complete len:488 (-) Transcript_45385:88-1551(-)